MDTSPNWSSNTLSSCLWAGARSSPLCSPLHSLSKAHVRETVEVENTGIGSIHFLRGLWGMVSLWLSYPAAANGCSLNPLSPWWWCRSPENVKGNCRCCWEGTGACDSLAGPLGAGQGGSRPIAVPCGLAGCAPSWWRPLIWFAPACPAQNRWLCGRARVAPPRLTWPCKPMGLCLNRSSNSVKPVQAWGVSQTVKSM